jgi:NitT/TauT family transport system ATP-binding protein
MSTPSPLLHVRDLEKAFDSGGASIIRGLSLDIHAGEFVSIVGPSGCGKSTFLHMVAGFESITRGTMTMLGDPINAPSPRRGMMFQDFSLYPWLTVLQNVCWPLEMKKISKPERIERARGILETVNLSRYAHFYPEQLSGGMKQRVALARLLALDPEMFLMDEPFGALDAQMRELLQEELQQLWFRFSSESSQPVHRKTVLFVTHDLDEAVFLSTRVLVFAAYPGRIKADIAVPAGPERDARFRKSDAYHRTRDQIWDLLREEVLKVREHEEPA